MLSGTTHKAILSRKQISIGFDDCAVNSGEGVVVIVIMRATIPLWNIIEQYYQVNDGIS